MRGPELDFTVAFGGVPDDPTAAAHNTAALNHSLRSLKAGETLLIPPFTFHINGGVEGAGLRDVTLRIDGRLSFSPDIAHWPHDQRVEPIDPLSASTPHPPCPLLEMSYTPYAGKGYLAGLNFWNCSGLTLTSSRRGELFGNGQRWWSVPLLGYLLHGEHRPRLLTVFNSVDTLIENLLFADPPYWTTLFEGVDGLEIRHCGVVARRTAALSHSLVDLSAFNTDGFDVAGRNVWIHDCDIWTQDDAIAVKQQILECPPNATYAVAAPSENMLFERINASGLGLVIGSIAEGHVRNITFRDSYLRETVKGIYLKFGASANQTGAVGRISQITFQNITMDGAEQWPIWIGPAQQADSRNPCHGNPCSLCWPVLPGAECGGSRSGQYEDLLLQGVHVYSSSGSSGVLLGSAALPMRGVTFDDVIVHPECGAASALKAGGFASAFRHLPQQVSPDLGVLAFYPLLAVSALLALTTASALWVCASPRARACALRLCGLLLLCVGALAARLAWLSPALRDKSTYYLCEGVEGGVAMGGTWPVPPCFADRTTRAYGPRDHMELRGHPCTSYQREPWSLGVASALVLLAATRCLQLSAVAGLAGSREDRSDRRKYVIDYMPVAIS